MSQDPFWRNVKAGPAVHTGDIQGRAPPNEGVTEGVERFKSEAAESMGGPRVPILAKRTQVTLNY